VPNRIPFASELKVEDGAPVTQNVYAEAKGKVKYFLLKGDYLERTYTIREGEKVDEKGLFAVIVDDNNREATRHYIARGSIIKVQDNTLVSKNDLIASPKNNNQVIIADWDPYSEPIIAEANGTGKFQILL